MTLASPDVVAQVVRDEQPRAGGPDPRAGRPRSRRGRAAGRGGRRARSWPKDGELPTEPCAWLIRAGRNRGIDGLRRAARFAAKTPAIAADLELRAARLNHELHAVPDDTLRLIFTCCHRRSRSTRRSRSPCARWAGSPPTIARAFLAPPATIAQRLVRTKARNSATLASPTGCRRRPSCPSRVEEGRARRGLPHLQRGLRRQRRRRSGPARAVREAIRLGRLLAGVLDVRTEATALLALMLLTDARRPARIDAAGDLVLLEDQDRAAADPPRSPRAWRWSSGP